MKPSLRLSLVIRLFPVAVGLFLLSSANAQDSSAQATNAANAPKPLPRQVQPAPARTNTPPVPQPVSFVEKTPPAPAAQDAAAKTAEIIALQKQIKDKQKHIELLMRLFATDERRFLLSPTDAQEDPATQARIRAEQEELRAESTACSRLQSRLDVLTSVTPHP